MIKKTILLISLFLYSLCGWSKPVYDVNTYVPQKAHMYLPIVKEQVELYMPNLKYPHYFGALIEQESCISLTHKRCWDPSSELRSQREQGLGLGQATRAFNKDGSVRFDTLDEMRQKYKDQFKELSWDTFAKRPDLQVRVMVYMVKTNYNLLSNVPDEFERMAFSDAAYNGGYSGLNKERMACGLAKGCDAKKWFSNVERYCLKSKVAIYGQRSACDINREHPYNAMKIRLEKYRPYFID
jgi:hypothetical protein